MGSTCFITGCGVIGPVRVGAKRSCVDVYVGQVEPFSAIHTLLIRQISANSTKHTKSLRFILNTP